jgi:hypothetical protein
MCLFTNGVSTLVKYLLGSLFPFLIGLFVLSWLSFKSSLYTLDNSLANMFFELLAYLLIHLIKSF